MKKLILSALLVLSLSVAFASVKPGENILTNGQFSALKANGVPQYWVTRGDASCISFFKNGGPKNLPYIRIGKTDGSVSSGEISVRQYGITLKEGESYKISAWVRTKNFMGKLQGIGVINFDWYDDISIRPLPQNQDWTYMEKTVNMLSSLSKTYVGIIFAGDSRGTLDVADFRIEAVSAGALAHSEIMSEVLLQRQPRLVAMSPILAQIPEDRQEITFRFFGQLPDESVHADYDITLETTGNRRTAVPLAAGDTTVRLPEGTQNGDLHVRIIQRATGRELFHDRLSIEIHPRPEIRTDGHRRLNNLVTELLNVELVPGKEADCTFYSPKTGWHFIALENAGKAENIKAVLDGTLTVILPDTPRLETFRHAEAGKHTLTITGVTGKTRLIVRAIPDIFNYCPGFLSGVEENPPYDWEFYKAYVLHAVTTLNGGTIAADNLKQFHQMGYKWVGNLVTRALSSDSDLASRLERSRYITTSDYDGAACDEQGFDEQDILERFTKGLKMFRNHHNKTLYSWTGGLPATPVDVSYVSACVNASRGDGRILMECYLPTQPTRQMAEELTRKSLKGYVESFNQAMPGSLRNLGVIWGIQTQSPIMSVQYNPEVDFKAHFDLGLQLLSTMPECSEIATTGCWGSYYAEEEHHRWVFKVLRHYCIEGKTSSLAEEYGFSYLPGHIHNSVFADGLNGWRSEGDVTIGRVPPFGSATLGMLGAGNLNETMAVFTKKQDEISRLTQTIRGLVPGKTYALQFATCDFNDAKAKRNNPRLFGIGYVLGDGATIDAKRSWVHIDKREKGRYTNQDNVARVNLHRVIFTAQASDVMLRFDNSRALPGEALALTMVTVKPFWE